jgi:hypothetical protein
LWTFGFFDGNLGDIGNVIEIVIGPDIKLFTSIDEEGGFDTCFSLYKERERNKNGTTLTVIDLHLLVVLKVGEKEFVLAEFAVHENNIRSLIRSTSLSRRSNGTRGRVMILSKLFSACPFSSKYNGITIET